MNRQTPKIIKDVGFDFSWSEQKVWQINAPVEDLPIAKLVWHFDFPFLWSRPNGFYDVKPSTVIAKPNEHATEYQRTMRASTRYPIDIMFWRGRWVILDGLHRLMKLYIQGAKVVSVRKIPKSAIPLIKK